MRMHKIKSGSVGGERTPDYIFLFDADFTITHKEILPEVSKQIGKYDEMRQLTEPTM